jgi:hypothetical protein
MTEATVNFDSLDVAIPESVLLYTIEVQQDIFDYILQMDDESKKAYLIAKSHLGSSFNILKSNGYKEWKNKN